MSKFDCIFIPGGGLNLEGSLPSWTLARIDRALALQGETRWIALLSGGTVHKPPPLDGNGQPVFESRAGAEYLIRNDLPAEKILTEICSYDTIGNAYFSRLLFAEPLKLKKILVITSFFHLDRTREAFEWAYELTPLPHKYEFKFESVPDVGLTPDELRAREKRESKSLDTLRKNRARIRTLAEFTKWLYSEHDAYTSGPHTDRLSDAELKSY